jgi:apolipoprotein N-acyltransferase
MKGQLMGVKGRGKLKETQAGAVETRPAAPSPQPSSQGSLRSAFFHFLPCLVPALASALLLWLCYFPVAWGWLGWVALVPFLCLVRSEARARYLYPSAYLGGLLFFFPVLSWIKATENWGMYAAWALLAVYLSFYFVAALFLLRRLDRHTGLPLVVTVPVVWTALELLRSHMLGGFAWYYLGHTQHSFLALIQVSDLTGAYGVTFVVAAVNALAFSALYAQRGFRKFCRLPAEVGLRPWYRKLPAQGAAVAVVLAATLGYGAYRLDEENFKEGPRVALLQINVDQRLRNVASSPDKQQADKAQREIILTTRDLSKRAARSLPRPDLIVWPETSFPAKWVEVSSAVSGNRLIQGEDLTLWRKAATYARWGVYAEATRWQTNLLLGLESRIVTSDYKVEKYNSALLVSKDGKAKARYDKIHRVPFGEYVPFRETLPFMDFLNPYGYDYSVRAGKHQTRFPLIAAASGRPYHFGVLICYEDTDPNLARQYAHRDGDQPPADFLINISNDGWFDGSAEHEEHLAISRFRAVEARRPLVRSVNMGVSAVIDGSGRVLRPETRGVGQNAVYDWRISADGQDEDWQPGKWSQLKKVQGVLTAAVPIDDRTSLYARFGDWLPGACWAVLLVGMFWPHRKPAPVLSF